MFHIGGTVEIKGEVNAERLRRAISRVICTNDAFRLRFRTQGNGAVQYLYEGEPEIELLDLSGEAEPELAYERLCADMFQEPFILEGGRMYRFLVCRLRKNKTVYFVKLHHLIADGWSMKLLTEQITSAYEMPDMSCGMQPSYLEHVAAEAEYLTQAGGGAAEKSEAYFRERIKAALRAGEYVPPVWHTRGGVVGCERGKRLVFRLDGSFCERLDGFLAQNHLTLSSFFTCVYLLYNAGSGGTVTVGIPLLGRSGRRERQAIGNFTNVLPFVYEPDGADNMREMYRKVSAEMYALLRHQRYPSELLEHLIPEEKRGGSDLYSVCINEYHTELPRRMCGYQVTNTELYNGFQEYALQIIIRRWDGGMNLEFDYRLDVFSDEDIDRLYQIMMLLSEQVMLPELKVSHTQLLSPQEWKADVESGQTAERAYPKKSFPLLFRETAEAHPLWLALSSGGTSLSYVELDGQVERAAAYLQSCGVQPGTVTALLPHHTIQGVILLLAVLRCGGVMLPLDPGTPADRQKELLVDSGARYLIGDASDAPWPTPEHGASYPCGPKAAGTEGFQRRTGEVTFLDASLVSNGQCAYDNLAEMPFPDIEAPAYILYTSGTSGHPKGTRITHLSLTNYLMGASETYLRGRREVFALYTSFAYDFTLTSLLLPLISGGEVRVSAASETNAFERIFGERRVTVLKLTPSHLPLLFEAGISGSAVHTVIFGGENLPAAACRRLDGICDGRLRIFNEYGPTETTVGCAVYRYRGETSGIVPVGRPMPNVRIYLMDRLGRPVPRGMCGEIYIGGAGVAEGYLNGRDDSGHFSEDPFVPGKKLYRTGDAGMRRSNGELVCLGRLDRVVKIRGVRVSLAEVEKKLLTCTDVRGAAVKVTEIGGTPQLCAYILSSPEMDIDRLRDELAEQLPAAMMPAFFIRMESFPLTAVGKIDMEKLPLPRHTGGDHDGQTAGVGCSEEAEEERMEERPEELKILIQILSDVLEQTDIGIKTNYYAAGGDSIKAIIVSSRLRELGYGLEVRDILLNPVVVDMFHRMKRETSAESSGPASGSIAGTPAVSRFFGSNLQNPGWYGQSVLLNVGVHAGIPVWERVFEELIAHHDALRINYDAKQGRLFYNPAHIRERFHVKEMDLRSECLTADPISGIGRFVQKDFDLETDLMLRVFLLRLPDTNYLYVTAHHLVMDAVSFQILLADMETLYRQISQGKPVRLPAKSASYQSYAEACSRACETVNARETLDNSGFLCCGAAHRERFTVGEEATERFLTMGLGNYRNCGSEQTASDGRSMNAYDGVKQHRMGEMGRYGETPLGRMLPDEWLLSVFAAGMSETLGLERVACVREKHGRDLDGGPDVTRTVGWFTQTEFFLLYPAKAQALGSRIADLTKQFRCRKAARSGVGRPDLCLNNLGECPPDNDIFQLIEIVFDDDVGEENTFPCLCDVIAYVLHGRLRLVVTLDGSIPAQKRNALITFVSDALRNL